MSSSSSNPAPITGQNAAAPKKKSHHKKKSIPTPVQSDATHAKTSHHKRKASTTTSLNSNNSTNQDVKKSHHKEKVIINDEVCQAEFDVCEEIVEFSTAKRNHNKGYKPTPSASPFSTPFPSPHASINPNASTCEEAPSDTPLPDDLWAVCSLSFIYKLDLNYPVHEIFNYRFLEFEIRICSTIEILISFDRLFYFTN